MAPSAAAPTEASASASIPFTAQQTSRRWTWLSLLDLDSHPAAKRQPVNHWAPAPRPKPAVQSDTNGRASPDPTETPTHADDGQGDDDDDGWQLASSSRRKRRQGASTMHASQSGAEEFQQGGAASSVASSSAAATKGGTAIHGSSRNLAVASTSAFALLGELGSKEVGEEDVERLAKSSQNDASRKKVVGAAKSGGEVRASSVKASADRVSAKAAREGTSVAGAISDASKGDSAPCDPLSLAPHPDESQVDLDVRRSFVGDAWVDWRAWEGDKDQASDEKAVYVARQRKVRMAQLDQLVKAVLRRGREAAYYQGYHDVLSLLLVVLVPLPLPLPEGGIGGPSAGAQSPWPSPESFQLALQAAERVTLHWLRDAMTPTLEPALGWLKTTRNLLRIADVDLSRLVERPSPLPYSLLSWQISLFAHDVSHPHRLAHLVTHVLTEGPQAVVYTTVAILLEAKARLVQQLGGADEAWRADPAEIHQAVGNLPTWIDEGRIGVEDVVERARRLRVEFELDPVKTRTSSETRNGASTPTEKEASANGKPHDVVMASGSVLHSWSSLPLRSARRHQRGGAGGDSKSTVQGKIGTAQEWIKADASAVDTLRQVKRDVRAVVLDATVEPEDMWDKEDEKLAEKLRDRSKGRGKGKERGSKPSKGLILLGALGAGVIIVYSASRGDLAQVRDVICAGAGIRC